MKRISTIFCMVFLCSSLSAQQVDFGVKGGVNLATITGDGTDNLDFRAAGHAGIVFEIGFGEKLALQPEVLFSMQGAKEEATILGQTFESRTNLDYINVPILFKFYPVKGFHVGLGPQFGFLLSAKSKIDGQGEEDLDELMNDVDIALALNLGFKTESGFGVFGRYNLGVVDIFDIEDASEANQNAVIQAGIVLFFR